jgi:uncharacterized protein YjbJ (UPF0337 family)
MNWDEIGGRWDQLKGEAKKAWGELTDDDLARSEGNRERLAGALQERYGYEKQEAERKLDEWVDKLTDTIKPSE